jgi:hypothetical protein
LKIFYFATTDERYARMLGLFREGLASQRGLEPFELLKPPLGNQIPRGGAYEGWRNRFELIEHAFESTSEGETFISSDIDVRFYKNMADELSRIMSAEPEPSIWFQRESMKRGVNIGFMVVRNERQTRQIFRAVDEAIRRNLVADESGNTTIRHRRRTRNEGAGQDWVCDIVADSSRRRKGFMFNERIGFAWSRLPASFWHPGLGQDFRKDIVLHHATCASEPKEKLKQMGYQIDDPQP